VGCYRVVKAEQARAFDDFFADIEARPRNHG